MPVLGSSGLQQSPASRKPWSTLLGSAPTPVALLALVLLVLPLPALLLDLAWLALLAVSLLVALVALRSAPQLRLANFPSLLLLLTLLRLSLCLATLRAVLTASSTPALVSGVSALMVGGNAWLAWVLFLSLVIAQLLVVVRGNERIAEVLARFALDALPGRQLSIDAELRAGALHATEARRQRQALSTQSELFGTLDGVMKLVRGEQIALLFMVALCVLGGTALSVVDQHAAVGASFQRWSVIGIGIGLLAQLSTFTIALATGVILTRSEHDSRTETARAPIRVWSLLTRKTLPGSRRSHLESVVERVRAEFAKVSGLPLPPCHFEIDPRLAEGQSRLAVRGTPVQTLALPSGTEDPAAFQAALTECLWQHGAEFLGIAETQELIEQLDSSGSVTLGQVVPRLISINALSEILRRLVAERVSIRDLKAVLEALAIAANGESDVGALVEVVRSQLKRTLSHQHTAATGEIHALLIEPTLEGVLRGSIVRNKGNSTLSLSPAAARDFVAAVTRSLTAARASAPEQTVVVLASPEVRRFVRHLLETDHPDLPVLSPAELLPQTAIHPVGTVTLQGL